MIHFWSLLNLIKYLVFQWAVLLPSSTSFEDTGSEILFLLSTVSLFHHDLPFGIIDNPQVLHRVLAQALGPPNCPTSTRCGAHTEAEAPRRASRLERECSRSHLVLWEHQEMFCLHQTPHFSSSKDVALCLAVGHQHLVSAVLLWVVIRFQICPFSCFHHLAGYDLI